MRYNDPKFIISISFIWLFTIVAIIGFLAGYKEGFMIMLPMNILLYLIFIIWHNDWKQLLLLLFIPFSICLSAFMLAIRYEWILGAHQYGETLGYKIGGVPFFGGISWIILTYCTATVAQWMTTNVTRSTIIATLLFFTLHLLFTISASKLDLWKFKNGDILLRTHFIVLFVIYITQFSYQKNVKLKHPQMALHTYLSLLILGISFLFIKK